MYCTPPPPPTHTGLQDFMSTGDVETPKVRVPVC